MKLFYKRSFYLQVVSNVSNRKTFIQVEFAQQCLHFFFVVKQRPLFEKLEKKNKITIIYFWEKKYIKKWTHTLWYFFFVMNEKMM